MNKVSILMPVYNVEKYIRAAIGSILNQTYPNIELVIVDDASTDNTLLIIDEIAQKNNNIIIVRNDVNSGITVALNKGLKYCSGDYIARADGDDIQDPLRIQKQIDFLKENQEYGLVGCWIKNIDESGKQIASCKYPVSDLEVRQCVSYTSPVLHIWLAKKEVYEKLNGYRNTNPAEDYDFILRCLDYGIRIGNVPYYGSMIRLRSGSTLTESSLKQRVISNYLCKKFKKGIINTIDIESELPKTNELKIITKLHSWSCFFLKKAIENKRSLKGAAYLCLSLISPFTVQNIIKRQIFKRKCNKGY
ncbi:glycosyltransferase family 2 protein [Escherichia coli]|uniref:glycosyltransferase family 2 protein n=1 Tax=Escherichia coli TaxID=562 RepID=UPI0037A22480